MPSRQSPTGKPAARAKHAAPDAEQPAADDVSSSPATDNADEQIEDVPMNRAQRRAKGKGGSQPRPIGKILPGRTNLTHGPRSYANRRSGG
jgi:hypothetical protein